MKKVLAALKQMVKRIVIKKSVKSIGKEVLTKPSLIKRVLSLFSVKGILIVAALAVVALIIYYGFGLGKGNGMGDSKGDGNSKFVSNQQNVVVEDNKTETVEEQPTPTLKPEEEATDVFEGAILNITVMGNDYIYDNERITMDELIKVFDEVEGSLVVEVVDDNSSLRAYNKLLDKLEELKIDYVEKQ